MYQPNSLSLQAEPDRRPASAVSSGVGLAGLAGLFAWVAVAWHYGMDGPYAALTNVAACALPMVLWSLLVDKVHRNPSTGIDWNNVRPWRETVEISLTKLAGLWITWAGIAAIYATGRFYWEGGFAFSMWVFGAAAVPLFVLSIPYMLWIDRRLVEPKDGCWALGAWAMHLDEPIDAQAIWNHLRGWAVKAFFLAFMLAIVPPGFGEFIRTQRSAVLTGPVPLANWLITFMFVIDVAFATAGYILAMRPLDTHIRSATPYAAGWSAALICYPPFILMANGGPLDYHPGTADWTYWLADYPVLLWIVGAVLVGLTAIYAWATMAFGLRFSNLTHRGILTHGPYAFSRHPAYLSKNLFWWISTIPVLTTADSWTSAARSTAILAVVSGVYYWRAKTEEWHLGADPVYRAYSDWMVRRGGVTRLFSSSPPRGEGDHAQHGGEA
ncbi:isoprenylcysteine carboxylmethyltransferase family protein [uncultured Sphingomonas sp.]|uniref:methyltransferase family protein n=1 Tax=uncultured Sphingomonas sp. TaxID=158754 RepID=UPI0025D006E4|nr:isoprenylcysteine carboxylmethyltransferase family protein [uncultured Sphingomonas sp.]